VREGYLDHLLKLGELTREEADAIATQRREALEKELSASQAPKEPAKERESGLWSKYRGGREPEDEVVQTGVANEKLSSWLEAQGEVPQDFHPHPKIKKLLSSRQEMAQGKQPLDWSAAESLAFASLSCQGVRVRLTGQDTERGTFSQRHAVLHDYEDGHTYTPLQHLAPDQAPLEIINSPLSEVGVLGFEYGYTLDYPDGLILWEAQFGDFWNAAQPIVDQFIASAEDKWRRLSGLVMLLPHGMEGQGPEHSSARLERFLQLAAEDNIQVVYPTTPAQYFHVLRRQALRSWRKPLVIMTPKSLLRHPSVVSTLDECANGSFEPILGDAGLGAAPQAASLPRQLQAGEKGSASIPRQLQDVRRVLLCSGKIYYELEAKRAESKREDVAILRLEQLYPLPRKKLEELLGRYPANATLSWVQEEPENMGAWPYLNMQFGKEMFGRRLELVARPRAATPASGSHHRHKQEQTEIINRAFEQK
jgi:2-oxoglutarate dehydrogenase E1 component